MTVLAYDVYRDEEFARANQVRYVELDELFQQADYVTLHTPLLPETRGLVNAERLRSMKRGAYLINTARGELIDLDAVVAALESGQLAGAALDVFPKEPPTGHAILQTANAIVSPHVAGGSIEANLAAAEMACQSVVAVLQGGRVAHCVNPDVYETSSGP
jgi:phosphoglycerate dehydrogenase-like enzyme